MRIRAALLFGLAGGALAVVTLLSAPVGAAADPNNGWTLTAMTAEPQWVDVSRLPAASPNQQAPARLPLLVPNPAAYAAAKKSPKGIAGMAMAPSAATQRGAAVQAAAISPSFAGINSTADSAALHFTPEPPDTQLAAGPSSVLEMVNSTGQVFDKTGAPVTTIFKLFDFFLFSPADAFTPSDPRVLYDSSTGRWYATVLGFNASKSGVYLAVSKTSDPTGGWNVYIAAQGPGLCDQPKLGYSGDKFVIGCSLFNLSTGAYGGAILIVASKADGIAGATLHGVLRNPDTSLFALVPAQSLDAGNTAYVVFNKNAYRTPAAALFTVDGDPTNGLGGVGGVTFSIVKSIAMNPTTVPPAAPQKGVANPIDTGDDRFMSAVVHDGVLNTSGAEGCTPRGDNAVRSCMRLVQINVSNPSLVQGGTAGLVGRYMINPTLGLNLTNDLVIDYSTSSTADYPSFEVTIQPAGAPNTFMGGGVVTLGTGPYISTVYAGFPGLRWGDYGAVAIDPTDQNMVWVAGEFSNGDTTGTTPHSWGTAIAEVAGPLCRSSSLTANPAPPQGPGATITLNASTTCSAGATPNYQFWIKPPGGSFVLAQDYSASQTFNWASHVTLGTWMLELRTRATIETGRPYDTLTDIPYTITAMPCAVPTLTASPANAQSFSTPVTLTATTTCGAPPAQYQFWVKSPNGVWHMLRDYDTSNTYSWTTFNTDVGTYMLEVDVKNTGELGAYDNLTDIPYSLVVCTTPTLSTSVATNYPSGKGPITLAATGSCGGGTEYEFWYRDPSKNWHLIGGGYGMSQTATWSADFPPSPNYILEVDIRPAGSTAGYITYFDLPFALTGCGVPTLTPDKPSPQVAGTTVTWTVTVPPCTGTPQYEFWVRTPAGVWSISKPWDAFNTFMWTSPTTAGAYVVEVAVRNNGAVNDPFDFYTDVAYTLGLCSNPTLSTGAATTPYATGAGPITLTATGTCAGSTEFEFWWRDPSSAWHLIGSGYSGNTATWSANFPPGSYLLEVDIRPVGSSVGWVTYFDLPFSLTGCSPSPGLTPDKASPQVAGTSVIWTATATCSGTPNYQFWVRTPAGAWSIARNLDVSNSFVWTSPTTAGAYLVEVAVRNNGAANDPYDYYTDIPYSLGLCNTPTLSTGAATSPYPSGTGAITLTGTGTCAGSTEFEFWWRDTSNAWHLIGSGYGGYTATWKADYKSGSYLLEVDIRPVGSSVGWVTYFDHPFSLSGCGVPGLSSDKPSGTAHGTPVTWTPNVSCTSTPSYQFWVRSPAGVWNMIQDYGVSGTFAWTPATAGSYTVEVDVRNSGAFDDPYDNYTDVVFVAS